MYGEIYFHDYCIDDIGTPAKLSILKKDFVGEPMFIEAGEIPFSKEIINNEDDLIGGIYPTMATIRLIGDENFGMDDIFTSSDNEFKVIHYIDGLIDWVGFITPESFDEEDTQGIRFLELNAIDGLTKLKDLKFIDPTGVNYGTIDGIYSKSLLFAIKECLKKTELGLNIKTLVDRVPIIVTENYLPYTIPPPVNGFIYSTGFNGLSHDLVKVGNYFSYRYKDIEGVYTSMIMEVDRSEVGSGGGTGIKLNPPINSGTSIEIEAYFFTGVNSYSKDVLSDVFHDVRTWINPSAQLNKERKADDNKKYFEFTDGTFSCWDVLDSIALAFDLKISQCNGLWTVQALDINRVEEDHFLYNSDGVFIERISKDPIVIIPCDPTSLSYKAEGNKRYVDKTLKSVSVQYKYRYKTDGDNLTNIFAVGGMFLPDGSFPPNTFAPLGWERFSLANPITFNVNKPPAGDYLDLSTPNQFNEFNGIKSSGYKLNKGDNIKLSWDQRIVEFLTLTNDKWYLTSQIVLLANSGETYYLVNSEEQEGWTDPLYMSPNPKGKWISKGKDDRVFHFNSNYSTVHNPTPEGFLTPWSRITIHCEDIPEDGVLEVRMVGSARLFYIMSSSNGEQPNAWSYVLDENEWFNNGRIVYIEDSQYIKGETNKTTYVKWFKGIYNPRIQFRNIELVKITNSSNTGEGRLYEYVQEGDYFDKIDDIQILIGDEANNDHLSVLVDEVNKKVINKWSTKDGSLYVGTLGLTLAKSIMRRYYVPKKLIDGGISAFPLDLMSTIDIEDNPNIKWYIKTGGISVKEHSFEGTLCQFQNIELPIGGVDYGPNSVGSSGSGSTSSGGGASQSWVNSQGYVRASDCTLDKTLQRGNESAFSMKVRGVRATKFLTLPNEAVEIDDVVIGETYMHNDSGYLLLNNEKVKSGDSDKWEGRGYEETFDQGLKKTDNVEHNSIKTTSLEINGELGLNVTKRIRLSDDTIEDWFFESGRLVKVEIVE